MVAASPGSALNSSAFKLSSPGAFPFFKEFMALTSLSWNISVNIKSIVALDIWYHSWGGCSKPL